MKKDLHLPPLRALQPLILIWPFLSLVILPVAVLPLAYAETSNSTVLRPVMDRVATDPKQASSKTVRGLSNDADRAADLTAQNAEAIMDMEATLTKRISVEYKDVDIGSVLRSLAWAHKLNIVTSSDVKGKVSINLDNVSVDQALQAILSVNGLNYSKREGMIYVSTGDPSQVEMSTDVVNMKYIKAEAAGNMVKKLLSSKGDIKINEVANSVVVTDFPSNIEKIKDLIKKIDTAPKQILIEAKIVDLTSTDLAALGLQWSYDYAPQGTRGGLFDRVTEARESSQGSYNMSEVDSNLSGGQFSLDSLALKNASFSGSVDALIRDGKANLLASPSIAVINGQEARIVIGERFPYKERTQTTTGTTETTKFVDIGTLLRVSPQINDDGYITLYIHPEVSSIIENLDAGPHIKTREADTTVRVKEGETLVIGGLIKQDESLSKDQLPVVGKIPLLNYLFGNLSSSRVQTELAVFITPKILYSREEQELRRSKDAMEDDHYVLLAETGKQNVAEQVFRKARALEFKKGYESKGKTSEQARRQALSQYELIFTEFPESVRSAEAQYRAANLYRDFFSDPKKAKKYYQECASNYPHSRFAALSKKAYFEMERSKSA